MTDDFDAPNTKSGTFPECGQLADIWTPQFQEWECCYCNWAGRNPEPIREEKNEDQIHNGERGSA